MLAESWCEWGGGGGGEGMVECRRVGIGDVRKGMRRKVGTGERGGMIWDTSVIIMHGS